MGIVLSIPAHSKILQESDSGESRLIRRRRRRRNHRRMSYPAAYGRHVVAPNYRRNRRRHYSEDACEDQEYRHCLSFQKIKGPMSKSYTLFIYGGQGILIIGIMFTIAGFSSGEYGDGRPTSSEELLFRLLGPVMMAIGLSMATSGCSVQKRSQLIVNRVQDTRNLNECERFDPNSTKEVYLQLAIGAGFLLFLIGICFTAIGYSVRKYGKTGVEYMIFLGPIFIFCGFAMNVGSVCYFKQKSKLSGIRPNQLEGGRTAEENHDSGASSSDSEERCTDNRNRNINQTNISDNIWSTNFNFTATGSREPIKPPPYQQVAPQASIISSGFPNQELPPGYSSPVPGDSELIISRATEVPDASQQHNSSTGITNGGESSIPPIPPDYYFVSEYNDTSNLPPPPSYETATTTSYNHGISHLPDVC